MAGRLDGKVAFITGVARGQGRSHAVRFAEEGADIIGVDLCGPADAMQMYPPATAEDLAETVRQVEALGRRIIASQADVRELAGLANALDEGVARLGKLDIVLANAGIIEVTRTLDLTEAAWDATIGINLTGVWNTCKVALPHLIDNRGGAVVITSSTAGLKGTPNTLAYTAAKHGVVGVMRALAKEFGEHSIRVNTVHPSAVDTPMIQNEKMWNLFLGGGDAEPTREKAAAVFANTHVLPVAWLEPRDISNAALFLVSDEARYITGVALPVDAGYTLK